MRNLALFLLVLFLIAALLRVDFFFTIAYFFFAVYLLSRLWTQHTSDRLHVKRRFTDRAFPGDRVVVDVVMQNVGWLPLPWLEVHESLPVELIAPPFHRLNSSHGKFEMSSTCESGDAHMVFVPFY